MVRARWPAKQHELEAVGNLVDAVLDGNASHQQILVSVRGGFPLFRRFAPAWQGKARGRAPQESRFSTLPCPCFFTRRHSSSALSFDTGWRQSGAISSKRPEHERPVFELRMRQDERPDPGPRHGFRGCRTNSGSAPYSRGYRGRACAGPRPAAAPARPALDLLQEAQQGRRRQAGGKQRHLIDVRRLARRAEAAVS